MSNSELPTRVSVDGATSRLVDVAPGTRLRVIAVEPSSELALLSEGIGPGVELEMERRLVLGGPVVVRVGRARLALARSAAAAVSVERSG